MGGSLYQEWESPCALTEPVPEAFEFPAFDWLENDKKDDNNNNNKMSPIDINVPTKGLLDFETKTMFVKSKLSSKGHGSSCSVMHFWELAFTDSSVILTYFHHFAL